jgi:AcrR family transcriptional regulator
MRDETKRKVVAAARDLFIESGESAVTMRAVAKKAKVSPMATYRHFKGRADLMQAVMEQGHDQFLAYMARAMTAPTPLERLLTTGRAFLDFALENRSDFKLMFMRAAEHDRNCEPSAWRDSVTFRFLVDRIADCLHERPLPMEQVEVLALSVWALVHGLVSLFLAEKLAMNEQKFRSVYSRTVEVYLKTQIASS